jgi:4-hydroxybenzoate polyprenyltransferase
MTPGQKAAWANGVLSVIVVAIIVCIFKDVWQHDKEDICLDSLWLVIASFFWAMSFAVVVSKNEAENNSLDRLSKL